jgi:hypothetical protein
MVEIGVELDFLNFFVVKVVAITPLSTADLHGRESLVVDKILFLTTLFITTPSLAFFL